jgi:hypothetical protein
VKYVVLINCGATIDLTEPDALIAEDQVVFVADNHRPINLANFYSDTNIHMLCRLDSEELNEIPPHEDIYRDDHVSFCRTRKPYHFTKSRLHIVSSLSSYADVGRGI